VKVKASAVNRADILQRKGGYFGMSNPNPMDVIGLEMAGIVEAVGQDVSGWKVGDRCMSLLSGGGYAEYVCVPNRLGIRIPDNLSFDEAAAIPEAYLTAYQTLFMIGGVTEGQTVLLHAGASGVGTSAIQLLKQVPRVKVYVTVGSQEKIDFCLKLGADGAINYKSGDWSEALHKLAGTSSGGAGPVNVVLDCVGANYFKQNLDVLAADGRLVMIGSLGGSDPTTTVDLNPILRKRLRVEGSTLRSRTVDYKAELTKQFCNFALSKFGSGAIKPIIAKVFNWNNVSQAHMFMEEDKNIGKIVLVGM